MGLFEPRFLRGNSAVLRSAFLFWPEEGPNAIALTYFSLALESILAAALIVAV